MEVSGVVFRSFPCFSGAIKDSFYNQFSGGELRLVDSRDFDVWRRPRKFSGLSSSAFSDNGPKQLYVSSRCGEKKEKKKEKDTETANIKKKLKLIKGLSRDLSRFSVMGLGLQTEDGLIKEVKEKMISEATEVLLAQLRQLKAEEKEMKRKRKEEKAKLKARNDSESSSESSELDCGALVEMSRLQSGVVLAEPKVDESLIAIQDSLITQEQKMVQVEGAENRSLLNGRDECCSGIRGSSNGGGSSIMIGTSVTERIEVCMGGKCKKSGAATLLEEFERKVGIEGAVVGCKCMGKCRDGPNVRVLSQCNNGDLAEGMNGSVKPKTNPLCIGVGLEDVGVIVASFFGEEAKDFDLMAA